MGFIVRYLSDTATEHEMFETLEDALARVETLHNDPSTSGAMLFKQVPLKVQTVVRVSIGDDDAPTASVEPPPAAESTVDNPAEPPPGAMPLQPATPVPPAPAAGSEDAGKRRFSR